MKQRTRLMVLMPLTLAALIIILPTAVAAPEFSSHPPAGTAATCRVTGHVGVKSQVHSLRFPTKLSVQTCATLTRKPALWLRALGSMRVAKRKHNKRRASGTHGQERQAYKPGSVAVRVRVKVRDWGLHILNVMTHLDNADGRQGVDERLRRQHVVHVVRHGNECLRAAGAQHDIQRSRRDQPWAALSL